MCEDSAGNTHRVGYWGNRAGLFVSHFRLEVKNQCICIIYFTDVCANERYRRPSRPDADHQTHNDRKTELSNEIIGFPSVCRGGSNARLQDYLFLFFSFAFVTQ